MREGVGAEFETAVILIPSNRERIGTITWIDATICSLVVPLEQHQITTEIVRQLENKTEEEPRNSGIISQEPWVVSRCNVGTVWMVNVLRGTIEWIRNKLETMIGEAVSRRNFAFLNRACEELEVTLVMSREDHVNCNIVPLGVGNLRVGWHSIAKDIEICVVVLRTDHSTLSQGSTAVCAVRTVFLGIIVGGPAGPNSILPGNEVTGPRRQEVPMGVTCSAKGGE